MPSSEELLRSIERTREELALTVDTIAGRLQPKAAAKRGVTKVKSRLNSMVDGARSKVSRDAEPSSKPSSEPSSEASSEASSEPSSGGGTSPTETAGAMLASAGIAVKSKVAPVARRVPMQALGGGLAALLAFAAIMVWRRNAKSD